MISFYAPALDQDSTRLSACRPLGQLQDRASQLFLTPSAVSHQIRTARGGLGVTLFHRGARTLTLTDAGASYLHEIEYLFERLDTATRELRARAGAARCDCGSFVLRQRVSLPRWRLCTRRSPRSTGDRHRRYGYGRGIPRMRTYRSCWAPAPGAIFRRTGCSRRLMCPPAPSIVRAHADQHHRASTPDSPRLRGA